MGVEERKQDAARFISRLCRVNTLLSSSLVNQKMASGRNY